MADKRNETYYLTVLSVLSTFSVVMLHTNGVFWEHPTGRLLVSSAWIESFFYYAVPVFFMISGCNLMDYSQRYSTKVFFQKRLVKTGIPFLGWSLVGLLYRVLDCYSDWNPLHILSNIFNSGYIAIYWFFPHLFAVYLCMPILTQIRDKQRVFRYASAVGFLFLSVLPFCATVLGISYNTALIPTVVNGYVLYAMLGYFLAQTELKPGQRTVIYALGLLGFLAQFLGTILLSTPETVDSTFKGYLNWPCVFQSSAVFVFVKYACAYEKGKKPEQLVRRVVDWAAPRGLGIYLIHIYFVWELPDMLHFNNGSILWRTLGAAAVFAVSTFCVSLLQKIPFVRRFVP